MKTRHNFYNLTIYKRKNLFKKQLCHPYFLQNLIIFLHCSMHNLFQTGRSLDLSRRWQVKRKCRWSVYDSELRNAERNACSIQGTTIADVSSLQHGPSSKRESEGRDSFFDLHLRPVGPWKPWTSYWRQGVPEKIRVLVQVLRESNTWRFSSLPLYLCPFILHNVNCPPPRDDYLTTASMKRISLSNLTNLSYHPSKL